MSTILREGHFDDGAQLQAAKAAVSHTAFFNLLEGDGSAGALEHYFPSKVSSRNEVEVTDRSLPYVISLLLIFRHTRVDKHAVLEICESGHTLISGN